MPNPHHPSVTSGTGICFRPRSARSARSGGAAAGEARERGRAVTAVTFAKEKVQNAAIIHFYPFLGKCSILNHPAIGDPPFMETLISDSHTISCL